ncbi:hypothetical protein GP486_005940 [Trichoglossum hirsutum]|uniref:ABC transporter domain-containing protein n=1 Tax=Trichoglossum hirsutum TaxID=265104 RepID=A0A9P8L890_9PEZI|nr:hypothetical protein GP486_005940 [Trichoglossum hirsutum]
MLDSKSRREETDFSLLDYLHGRTELNPVEGEGGANSGGKEDNLLITAVRDLKLRDLLTLPVGNLSNGQTRRARIAKALIGRPEVLLLDEPFMGLDPPTVATLSPLLGRIAASHSPRLILSLRPQDPIPQWITHLVYLGPTGVRQGTKDDILRELREQSLIAEPSECLDQNLIASPQGMDRVPATKNVLKRLNQKSKPRSIEGDRSNKQIAGEGKTLGEPLVEMNGVRVRYGEKEVVGGPLVENQNIQEEGLWWTVRRGDRWGLFGPNGSGKTTILSLICSDHPQSYSQPLRIFGHSRLPAPGKLGISIFDIQQRIGHSSPEIHAFFPKDLTVRHVLENAWADTFLSKPQLNASRDRDVDACLRWFQSQLNPNFSPTEESPTNQNEIFNPAERTQRGRRARKLNEHRAMEVEIEDFLSTDLDWADTLRFGDLPFSAQRVALFLRAVIKKPDLVILDEALSGMDDFVRDKCMLFLAHGETKTFTGGLDYRSRKQRGVQESILSAVGRVRFQGLGEGQALICVSHVKEEVPPVVKEWLVLPEAGSGLPMRLGRIEEPLGDGILKWGDIWAK